jgi:hypothetical protein
MRAFGEAPKGITKTRHAATPDPISRDGRRDGVFGTKRDKLPRRARLAPAAEGTRHATLQRIDPARH